MIQRIEKALRQSPSPRVAILLLKRRRSGARFKSPQRLRLREWQERRHPRKRGPSPPACLV